jgi:glycosyltransferase involved in cell wall biosynthesis
MKVAFVSILHPAFDKRVYDKEAVCLARAGHEIHHICFPHEGYPSERAEADHGVEIVLLSTTNRMPRSRKILTMARHLVAHRYDALHCNELDSWLIGCAIKLIYRRTKVVFDVHECYLDRLQDRGWSKASSAMARRGLRWLIRLLSWGTDHVILAKDGAAEDFRGIEAVPRTKVRNYVSVRLLEEEDASASAVDGQLGLPAGATCVHSGLFSVIRGWPQVVDAFGILTSRLVEANLLVMGSVNDGTVSELEQRVQASGFSGRYRRLDWLGSTEAFSLLRQCDIGLVTFQPGPVNHLYALPHKVFDYMLAGLAVIVPTFAREVAPMVENARCGLTVDVSDPGAIADAIEMLANDSDLRKAMGARGREAVLQNYNWEQEERRLLEIYAELSQEMARGSVRE